MAGILGGVRNPSYFTNRQKTAVPGSNLYNVKTSSGINGIGGFGRPRPAVQPAPAPAPVPAAPAPVPFNQPAGPAVRFGGGAQVQGGPFIDAQGRPTMSLPTRSNGITPNKWWRRPAGVPGANPTNQTLADIKMSQFQAQRNRGPAPVASTYNAPNNNAAKFSAPTPGPLPSPNALANPGTNAFPNNRPAMNAPTNVWGNKLIQARERMRNFPAGIDIIKDAFGYRR